jgi:hypothetical protein
MFSQRSINSAPKSRISAADGTMCISWHVGPWVHLRVVGQYHNHKQTVRLLVIAADAEQLKSALTVRDGDDSAVDLDGGGFSGDEGRTCSLNMARHITCSGSRRVRMHRRRMAAWAATAQTIRSEQPDRRHVPNGAREPVAGRPRAGSTREEVQVWVCSQNIFSSTHHIESLDAYVEY